MQKCKNAKMQKCKKSKMRKCKNGKMQKYKNVSSLWQAESLKTMIDRVAQKPSCDLSISCIYSKDHSLISYLEQTFHQIFRIPKTCCYRPISLVTLSNNSDMMLNRDDVKQSQFLTTLGFSRPPYIITVLTIV